MEHQDWNPVVWGKTKSQQKVAAAAAGARAQLSRQTHTASVSRQLDKAVSADEAAEASVKVKPAMANAIKEARMQRSLSQVQVAHQMSVRPNVVRDWENGTARYCPDTWVKFQRALGLRHVK